MFQDYALFPNMTVEKNIMTGMGKKPEKAIVQDYIRRSVWKDWSIICHVSFPEVRNSVWHWRA